MFEIRKDASFSERNIPLGVLEVSYPENGFDRDALHTLIERELAALRERYADYDRKAVFGENPYFRFFRKFKKTYPVMQQFETVMFKGRPFPEDDPVTALPFLLELTTFVLSGTHDIDRLDGALTIFTPDAKLPFDGMRGDSTHTYPNDICGRDDTGIIFSMIAGADNRTCVHEDSRHVFYPVFGTPDTEPSVIETALETLSGFVRTVCPSAAVERAML